MANKIISSINAIIDNQTLPSDTNNVVAIDTQNSRIGLGTASPQYQIDVTDTIRTKDLIIKTNGKISDDTGNIELAFDTTSISTQSIELSNIKLNEIIKNDSTQYINISGDISNNGLIIVNDLSVNNQLFVYVYFGFSTSMVYPKFRHLLWSSSRKRSKHQGATFYFLYASFGFSASIVYSSKSTPAVVFR